MSEQTKPEQRDTLGSALPVAVGLCPDPWHTKEWYMPLDEERTQICPECRRQLVVYVRKNKPRSRS